MRSQLPLTRQPPTWPQPAKGAAPATSAAPAMYLFTQLSTSPGIHESSVRLTKWSAWPHICLPCSLSLLIAQATLLQPTLTSSLHALLANRSHQLASPHACPLSSYNAHVSWPRAHCPSTCKPSPPSVTTRPSHSWKITSLSPCIHPLIAA